MRGRADYSAEHSAGIASLSPGLLTFDGFEVDLLRRELRHRGRPVEIDPKPLSLLVYLVQNRDRAVSKEELLQQVWPDVVVSETALSSALKDLRRALGDDGTSQRIIRTHRRRGYRFVALVHEPGSSLAGGAVLPDRDSAPLVGRATELGALEAIAREAERHGPQVVLVRGEAGVGKTRLLYELQQALANTPFVVARGTCHEDDAVPYRPFIDALSSWIVLLDEDAGWVAGEDEPALRQLLQPGARRTRSAPERTILDGLRQQHELFTAFARSVLRLARRRPTLLWIDDVHAADPATLQLIGHLASELVEEPRDGAPLVLVASYRPCDSPDARTHALRELERQPEVHRLTLRGLPEASMVSLLVSLGFDPPPEAARHRLHEVTRGNPFLLLEWMRASEASGLDLDALAGSRAEGPEPGGWDLHAFVTRRLSGLPAPSRQALLVASFIGHRFGRLALAAALGCDEAAVAPLLAQATDLDLVVCEGRTYRFPNPFVRHALQCHADDDERRRIHARIADVLEDLYAGAGDEHALEIANHLLLAGSEVEPARTLRLARRAGNQAFANCAWRAAARFYEGALTSGADLGLAELAALHLRAGVAHNHDASAEACASHYERAATLFDRTGDVEGLCFARMYLARARFTMGAVGVPERETLRELEDLAQRVATSHPALRGRLLETVAEARWAAGDATRAALQAGRALRIGLDLDDDVLCHHASMGLALARFSRLEVREAVGHWQEALERARRLRDPWLEAEPAPRLAMGLLLLGRIEDAAAAVRQGREAARRVRRPAELSIAASQEAVLDLCVGRLDAAERHVEETLRWAERSRYPWATPFALAARACARASRMDWEGALEALDLLAEPKRFFEEPHPAIAAMVAVHRELVKAWCDPAEADVERALALASLAGGADLDAAVLSPLCALVEVGARVGEPAIAEPVLESLELAAQRGVSLTQGWVFLVPRILGVASALLGRADEACVRLGRAVRTARSIGARGELARSLVDFARVVRLRGAERDGMRAAEALAEARTLTKELDLGALAREILQLEAQR